MRSMLLLWFVGVDIRVIFSSLQTRAQSNTAKHTQNTAQFFFFTLLCSVVLCVFVKSIIVCCVWCAVMLLAWGMTCVAFQTKTPKIFACSCVFFYVFVCTWLCPCVLCVCVQRGKCFVCVENTGVMARYAFLYNPVYQTEAQNVASYPHRC